MIQLICTKYVLGDTTATLLTWAYVIWSDSYTNFEPQEWPRWSRRVPPPPPPRRSDLVHLTGKWCEGEGIFGFDEVDNFTVELIPCWHSFPVQFETRHGVMCHAASEREEKRKTWTLKKKQKNTTHFKQKATVEKLRGYNKKRKKRKKNYTV